ncbi:MAG: ribose-phosphate pyrophosphokinase [Spirochaetales bacterium]|nr:ribose-phosphate pyrophosphokinase [Spirochaetales bacterium]
MKNDPDSERTLFYTPERLAQEQAHMMDSSRGPLLIASCATGTYLAQGVVKRYEEFLAAAGSRKSLMRLFDVDRRFSNGETVVRLEHHVNGYDVFLFQSLFHPDGGSSINENYMAFFIAARALRESGARHITGVLPYLAYARQDKPTAFKREPVTAKLMADLTIAAGLDRLIVWAPHCGQLRGFYGPTPVDFLDPLTLFADEFAEFRGRADVVAVAPDVGASKFATHFGRAMDVNVAIGSKHRPEPGAVVISEIIGDFQGKKTAIILDDMISSGGSIYELAKKLVREKGIEEMYIGVSHNEGVGRALPSLKELHEKYGLRRLVVTNSIPQSTAFLDLPFVKVKCLSDILAKTINRIHYGKSVSEVFTMNGD